MSQEELAEEDDMFDGHNTDEEFPGHQLVLLLHKVGFGSLAREEGDGRVHDHSDISQDLQEVEVDTDSD